MAESFLGSAEVTARSGALARIRVLVRLRFAVMRNVLRRHPWQMVGAIIGAVYGLGVLVSVALGLIGLSFADPEIVTTVLVLGGAALVLGWMVGPIFASGMDRTLDPEKLVVLPISPSVRLAGLAAASLAGIPGIVTLLVAAMTAVAWIRSPLAAVAAIAALVLAPLAAITCVLACQLVISAMSRVAASRRFREVIWGVLLLMLVLLGPIMSGVTSGVMSLVESLPAIAEAVSWSPLGAVWAVPAELAAGDWLPAILKLVIAVATVVLLGWGWRAISQATVGVVGAGSRAKASAGTGWFGRFPDTPRGAIAARTLTYWLRDPRYLQSLIVVLVMPVVFGFVAVNSATPILLPGSTVMVAVLLSLSTFTDVSYDGTAFSTHLLRGVRGIDDRLGRIWSNALLAVPLILLVAVATTAIVGRFDQLPTLLGLTASVTLGGFGVASVCSALFVMPVPQSGESPFISKPGAGMLSMVGMAGSYGSLTVLSLPAIGFSIAAGITGEAWLAWTTLAVGVITGAVVFTIGVRWGAAIYDRRAPELYARVVAQG
ncbi:transporter [Leucobacter insecticola]|uniref:Transporter n=1 Tax=Leucobacter insecticola TaxID=2714934 RepID=A0A6G8FLA7_9MICO|nr:transporter [Leucobacter insecticola]QIM16862.1 transporter [Leucobacter insecticola]